MVMMRTPLTDEQVADLQTCFQTWVIIRQANGYADNPSGADVAKSCLLGRMTIQGKPPLDKPPPLAYSAPWYELVENNGADLGAHDVFGPFEAGEEGALVHICQYQWRVIRPHEVTGYIIECDNAGGEWVLRHRTENDPQAEWGRRQHPSDGTWTPVYLGTTDWILIGP